MSVQPKKRRKTKPSKASKEKRLVKKKMHAQIKKRRRSNYADDY